VGGKRSDPQVPDFETTDENKKKGSNVIRRGHPGQGSELLAGGKKRKGG